MATDRTVVSEFEEKPLGQPATKKATATPTNTFTSTPATTGKVLASVGTHISDGGKHNVGER